MRETVAPTARGRPTRSSSSAHPRAGRCRIPGDAVQDQRTGEDLADRHARIERRVRVLEDHLHAPPQRADRRLAGMGDVGAGKDDLAGRRFVQPRDQPRQSRLAATGFAHQSDGFAGKDLQVDAIDGAQHALALRRRPPSAAENASAGPRPARIGTAGAGSTGAATAAPAPARSGVCSEPPSCVTQQRAARPARHRQQLGMLRAFLDGEGAARAKAAAGWPGARVGRLAFDGDQPAILGLASMRGAACSSAQV